MEFASKEFRKMLLNICLYFKILTNNVSDSEYFLKHLDFYNSFKTNTWPISNTVFSMTRSIIHNLKLFSEIKIIKGFFYIKKLLTVFKTLSGFSILELILNWNHCRVFETKPTKINYWNKLYFKLVKSVNYVRTR